MWDPIDRRLGRGDAVDRPDLLRLATALADGTLLSPDSQTAMQPSFLARTTRSTASCTATDSVSRSTRPTPSRLRVTWGPASTCRVPRLDEDHGTAIAVMMNTANPGPQAFMAIEALTAVSQTD